MRRTWLALLVETACGGTAATATTQPTTTTPAPTTTAATSSTVDLVTASEQWFGLLVDWVDRQPFAPAVIVGDLAIPREIHVHHPGVDGQPAVTLLFDVGDDGAAICRSLSLKSVEGGREIRPVDLDVIRRGVYTWIPSVVSRVCRGARANRREDLRGSELGGETRRDLSKGIGRDQP